MTCCVLAGVGRQAERADLVESTLIEGKHVVTAPGMDLDEMKQMAEIAAGHPGQLCILDMEMRFLECVAALRSMLHDGALGELHSVAGSFRSAFGLQFRGDRRHTWWHSRRQGGGAIATCAPRLVDLMCHVSGHRVGRVQASGSRGAETLLNWEGLVRPMTTEDAAEISLEMHEDEHGSNRPW